MAEWRSTGTPCPIDETGIDLAKCAACRFFRGATTLSAGPPPLVHGSRWTMHCNWPRNGLELARVPLPEWAESLDI
ncbi:MAG TPA: hypothetical protein VF763_11395 [Candidatus Limnocylindrales bacterium]